MRNRISCLTLIAAFVPTLAAAHPTTSGLPYPESTLQRAIEGIYINACIEQAADDLNAYESRFTLKRWPLVYTLSEGTSVRVVSRTEFVESRFEACLKHQWVQILLETREPEDRRPDSS